MKVMESPFHRRVGVDAANLLQGDFQTHLAIREGKHAESGGRVALELVQRHCIVAGRS